MPDAGDEKAEGEENKPESNENSKPEGDEIKPEADEKKDEDGEAAKKDGAEKPDVEVVEPKKEKKKKIKKPKEPRYEWVDVVKKKTRTKRTDVPIVSSGLLGLPDSLVQQRNDQEFQLQAEMREIIDTDAKRNDLE